MSFAKRMADASRRKSGISRGRVERVEIEGLEELKASLEALGTEVATKIGVNANRDAAKDLLDILQQAAPYQPGSTKKYWKTKGGVTTADYGHLRDNLKVSREKARKQGHIVHRVSTGKAFWGSFLEYGTVNMAPRPWMRPAVEATRGYLLQIQQRGLKNGIEKATKRLARIAKRKAKGL